MVTTTTIKRFNLICHGLMWFWRENKDHLRILIPDEAIHVFKIGSVLDSHGGASSTRFLANLVPGTHYQLTGVLAGSMTGAEIAAGLCLPAAKKALVTRNGDAAFEIVIPLPDQIRAYCLAETRGVEMIPPGQAQAMLAMPPAVATCIVLSWFHSDGSAIAITDGKNSYPAVINGGAANLSIYAQEADPNQHDPHHGEKFQSLIHHNGAPLRLNATDGRLKPDGPPSSTSISVDPDELESLSSLASFTTDASGCVGGSAPEFP